MHPFSESTGSLTGRLGSLVMVGDDGAASGGTEKNCKSINCEPGLWIGGHGFDLQTVNGEVSLDEI